MSLELVLETTYRADLQPLTVAGDAVITRHQQIYDELNTALGQQHAELFAEPNADRVSGDIQWYTPIGGRAVPLASLAPTERQAAEQALASLVSDVQGYSDNLRGTGQTQNLLMAETLTLALEIPSESHVFVAGGRPIISGWGHVPRGPAGPKQILHTMASRTRARSAAAPIAATGLENAAVAERSSGQTAQALTQRRQRMVLSSAPAVAAAGRPHWFSWLAWLLFTLLMFTIGYLLLKNCALAWPGSGDFAGRSMLNFCTVERVALTPLPSRPTAEAKDRNTLLARLRDLDRQLEQKRLACAPPPPPRVKDETTKRVEDAKGKIGRMNVVLTWNTPDDLDLHIICPDGVRISYGNKSACGGNLDVDRNVSSIDPTPVESVVWEGAPPSGSYQVLVNRYTNRSGGSPTNYKVEVKVDGRTVSCHDGAVTGTDQVLTFQVPLAGEGPQCTR